ncbi:MAG: hypothetical protein HYX50_05355 [Chloroflexi bacterium]|nr:hypothetical protein [Chloroflexota bacterium]
MAERSWRFDVRDPHGRTRRGTVAWCARLPSPLKLRAGDEFLIVLLETPASVPPPGEGIAICMAGLPKIRIVSDLDELDLPTSFEEFTLPPARMAAFAAGRVLTAAAGIIEASDVFPPHSERPRFDRLAHALLESRGATLLAPYTAVLRIGLNLPPGADVLAALQDRLSPEDRRERPPPRAPAVVRLRQTLKTLRARTLPAVSLEQLTDDLRVLSLFDNSPMTAPALEALMSDVREAPRRPARPARPRGAATPANVVPLRRRPRTPRE